MKMLEPAHHSASRTRTMLLAKDCHSVAHLPIIYLITHVEHQGIQILIVGPRAHVLAKLMQTPS